MRRFSFEVFKADENNSILRQNFFTIRWNVKVCPWGSLNGLNDGVGGYKEEPRGRRCLVLSKLLER